MAGELLHQVDVDVEVFDDAALDDVAEVLDGEGAAVRAGGPRVVHQADVVVHGQVDVGGGELLRRHLGVAVELAVLVGPLPGEAAGRRAEVDAEDAVDRLEDALLLGAEVVGGGAAAEQVAQGPGGLAQLGGEDGVHAGGGGAALGLGHERLRHEAVLAHEVGEHVPLAAVGDRARDSR